MFYKLPKEDNVRFYGVELEIDGAGRYDGNAEKIYDTANIQNPDAGMQFSTDPTDTGTKEITKTGK